MSSENRKLRAFVLALSELLQKQNLTITVEPLTNEYEIYGEAIDWYMLFKITIGAFTYKFTWWEAYMLSLKEWQDMTNGKVKCYVSYQGNGEGHININRDGVMEFLGAPSGSGGDVSSELSVPHALIKPYLQAAVAKAQELGYLR